MLKHYLMIALRNLLKNKTQSFINIFGLALGLSASIMIMLINHSELTRDAFWKDAEKIYVVEQLGDQQRADARFSHLQHETKHQLKDFYPEIAYSARLFSDMTLVSAVGDSGEPRTFNESVSQIDPEFLDIFSFDIVQGDLNTFSLTRNGVILTESFAIKYFGNNNVTGKILTIDTSVLGNREDNLGAQNRQQDYFVVAVIKDIPYRTEIQYQIMIPHYDQPVIETQEDQTKIVNIYYNARTFIKLHKVEQLEKIKARLPEFADKALSSIRYGDRAPSEFTQVKLINIAQASLASEGSQSTSERVWMLFFLAIIIVSMASINTINLTLAAYVQRQREVALRKTLGAKRREIFIQFWIETLLSITASFLFALILLEYLIPWLSATLAIDNTRNFLYTTHFFGQLMLLVLAISVIIGCYPGIYLARIKPALILHASRYHETLGSIRLRKLLVVVQFLLSAALVIAAGIVSLQLYKTMNYKPGYQTKNILYAYHKIMPRSDSGQRNNLKQQILKLPGVEVVSGALPGIPGKDSPRAQVSRVDQPISEARQLMFSFLADADGLLLLNIPLIAGRTVKVMDKEPGIANQITEQGQSSPTDIEEIIINLQAVAYLGFESPAAAVGQVIKRYFNEDENISKQYRIVGVTDWLHLDEHAKEAQPTALWMPNMEPIRSALGVRFSSSDQNALNKDIQDIWQDIFGVAPNIWLLEDQLNGQYRNQRTTAKFIYIFSALAIVISTLGLYGLAALSAQKRTREIALRKLHGASAFTIIKMLAADFSKLVLIANIIAWPLALYAMNYWLQSFRLKIDLMRWGSALAVTALALALIVAWLTLTLQAWKVAQTKPADSLREE